MVVCAHMIGKKELKPSNQSKDDWKKKKKGEGLCYKDLFFLYV